MTKDEEIESLRTTLAKWQTTAYEVGEHRDALIAALRRIHTITDKIFDPRPRQ